MYQRGYTPDTKMICIIKNRTLKTNRPSGHFKQTFIIKDGVTLL